MRFYLGTHMTGWLDRLDVPLFVSHRRLRARTRLPVALEGWALDSGGFTEISLYGEWRTTSAEYVAAVRRYQAEIGRLEWCAPMDWMCEPFMLERTGLSILEHQRRTLESYLELAAAGLPVVPVLQGWSLGDYFTHLEAYAAAGIDLAALDRVGLGSVCRRQGTDEIARIVWALHDAGLRLHGFGVKTRGLATYWDALASCDSLAWSYNARRHAPLEGCTHGSCANCPRWAMRWRAELLTAVEPAQQRMSFA